MRHLGGAGYGHNVLALVQHPGQRELGRRVTQRCRNGLELREQRQVTLVVARQKARHGVADVAGGVASRCGRVIGQKASAQGAQKVCSTSPG